MRWFLYIYSTVYASNITIQEMALYLVGKRINCCSAISTLNTMRIATEHLSKPGQSSLRSRSVHQHVTKFPFCFHSFLLFSYNNKCKKQEIRPVPSIRDLKLENKKSFRWEGLKIGSFETKSWQLKTQFNRNM